MCADIEGASTHKIIIRGCAKMQPYTHRIMADRIECGTFLIASAQATLDGGRQRGGTPDGADWQTEGCRSRRRRELHHRRKTKYHWGSGCANRPLPKLPYRQAGSAHGNLVVTETIFENHFMHVTGLNRLGRGWQCHRQRNTTAIRLHCDSH